MSCVAWAGFACLELGPLEAGHSYILDRAGALEVLAIEANRRAFLKCLVVKEMIGLPSVRFVLGDFNEFLAGDRRALGPVCRERSFVPYARAGGIVEAGGESMRTGCFCGHIITTRTICHGEPEP